MGYLIFIFQELKWDIELGKWPEKQNGIFNFYNFEK